MRRPPVIGLTVLLAASLATAGDWPQFRGPQRDGVSRETGLLSEWPADGPPELWTVELGGGYSGMAVADGRLFTMFSDGGDEFVVALDVASGKELWRVRAGDKFKDMFGDGPRSTPTVDGERVYAMGAKGKLLALAAADGKELWSHDLVAKYGAESPRWGFSASPIVDGASLLLDVGGADGSSIVAFDTKSGVERWRSQEDKAGYSAPVLVEVGEQRQAIFFTGTRIVSLDPADGELLWKKAWRTSYDVNAATPVFIPPDRLFISSGYDVGGAVYKIGSAGVEEVWRNREMKNKFHTSVLHDGHLYGFDEKIFKCIDAATGRMQWQVRDFGHGSLIYADGHLIALGDKGLLGLIEATPEAYREKSRAAVLKGKSWTPPTLADGKLYVRDEKVLRSFNLKN
jgi:outer membrane protein assembly factor BamB